MLSGRKGGAGARVVKWEVDWGVQVASHRPLSSVSFNYILNNMSSIINQILYYLH